MTSPDLHHALYVPRYLMAWQGRPGAADHEMVDGTLLLADISGFTELSEELAAQGRMGSEQVTEVLNGAFSELLDVASLEGGDLLSFGGGRPPPHVPRRRARRARRPGAGPPLHDGIYACDRCRCSPGAATAG